MSKRPSFNNKSFRQLRNGGGSKEITGVTLAGGDGGGTESGERGIELAGKKPPGLLCPVFGGFANGGTVGAIAEGSCREPIVGKEGEDDIKFVEICDRMGER